jgi:hypothetical protein
MAVGWHGQLIAVFPDLDIVAVVTARKFVKFGDVIDRVSAAVKSESVLPENPNAAELLEKAIKDASVEKSTTIGPPSAIAAAVSGRPTNCTRMILGSKRSPCFSPTCIRILNMPFRQSCMTHRLDLTGSTVKACQYSPVTTPAISWPARGPG